MRGEGDMTSRWWLVGALCLAACGGESFQCQTTVCGSSQTYEVCSNFTTDEYKLAGTTCSCKPNDSTGCTACMQSVAAFCGNPIPVPGVDAAAITPVPDAGDTKSTDLAMGTCTMSVGSALTGTFLCTVTTTYTTKSNLGGPVITMAMPVAGGISISASVMRPGIVIGGKWVNSDTGAVASITASSGTGPMWTFTTGTGQLSNGDYLMDLNVNGSTSTSTGDVYAVSGSLAASLYPVAGSGADPSSQVDFAASF